MPPSCSEIESIATRSTSELRARGYGSEPAFGTAWLVPVPSPREEGKTAFLEKRNTRGARDHELRHASKQAGASDDRPRHELVISDAGGTLRYVTVPGQHYPIPIHQHEWRSMPSVQATAAALPVSELELGIASNQPGAALGQ